MGPPAADEPTPTRAFGSTGPVRRLSRQAWIRSRVAWRLFALFLLSAVVPSAVVAFVGYQQLTAELRHDGEQRLEESSKAIGLEVFGRIQELANTLEDLDRRAGGQAGPWPRSVLRELSDVFVAVTFRGEAGALTLLDTAVEDPRLDPESRAHLRRGKPLVVPDVIENSCGVVRSVTDR